MLAALRKKPQQGNSSVTAVIGFSLFIGAIIPWYVDVMDGQTGKLLVLPALLVSVFLLWYDKKLTLILIILFRASGDIFLESTRFSLGSYQVGIGGLINALIIFVTLLMIIEKPNVIPKNLAVAWTIFLTIALCGVAISPAKSDAIRMWLSLVSSFMIFTSAFYLLKTKKDFRYFIKLILASSAIPIVYAFVDIFLNSSSGGVDGFRLKSTFSHPNIFAFYLTLLITLTFYLFKTTPKSSKLTVKASLASYLLLLFIFLLLTKTRSAWIGCYAFFFLYSALFERRYFIYLLAVPLAGLLIPGVADRLLDLTQGNEVIRYSKLNSFAWRVELWNSAINWSTPLSFITGHGLQSFKEYSPIFFPLAGEINWGAHSVVVQLLFELGIFGLTSMFWLYYIVFKNLKMMLSIDRLGAFSLLTIIFSYIIYSFSDNMLDYLAFNWYMWFTLGLGCALVSVNRIETNSNLHASRHPYR